MTDLPNNFSDGDELPASAVNQILATRTGDIKPIDDTTRNYTDEAGEIGTSTVTWEKGTIGGLTFDGAEIGTTAVGGQVKITKTLGAWDIDGHTVGTNYPAATDLFICAHIEAGNQQGWAIEGYSDGTATPEVMIVKDSANYRLDGGNTTYVTHASITFPVRKGDYWRVDEVVINAATGPSDLVINLIPLGG